MKLNKLLMLLLIIVIIIEILILINRYNPFCKVEVPQIISQIDYDNDGIMDSQEYIYGARKDVANKVKYINKYYAGGYPPDDEGVCTDVIWRAFMEAGYNLRDMINQDIKDNREEYSWINDMDKNIDFRRVRNLEVFFDRNAQILTNEIIPGDIQNLEQWQGGDIVIFGEYKHIAIISDKRNAQGVPYIIHNGGPYAKEENALLLWRDFQGGITKHYRFS